ncbi:MAG: hypothetical protein AAGD01_05630 [Acidobacteriota bacterium]
MGLAVIAVFLPWEWIRHSSEGLGLEPLPEIPLAEYLVRTLSLLYAIYGSMMWITASDPRRYAVVIRYMALAAILFGVLVFFIDRSAGMPPWWIAAEVAGTAGSGCITLALSRTLRRSP